MLLSGKVAIITGGAKGIGKGISLKFAEEGCNIAIADINEEEAANTLTDVKAKGVFLCRRAVAPHMIAKKSGKIINMASIAAIAAGPPAAHYGASKGGIMSLTLDLAVELARFNICVNSLLPGTIRTDMGQQNIPPGAK